MAKFLVLFFGTVFAILFFPQKEQNSFIGLGGWFYLGLFYFFFPRGKWGYFFSFYSHFSFFFLLTIEILTFIFLFQRGWLGATKWKTGFLNSRRPTIKKILGWFILHSQCVGVQGKKGHYADWVPWGAPKKKALHGVCSPSPGGGGGVPRTVNIFYTSVLARQKVCFSNFILVCRHYTQKSTCPPVDYRIFGTKYKCLLVL